MKNLFFPRYLAFGLLVMAVVVSLPGQAQAQLARMTADQLPPLAVVSETEAQLAATDCAPSPYDETTQSFSVAPDKAWPVIASESLLSEEEARIWFCSRPAFEQLHVEAYISFWKELLIGCLVGGAVGTIVPIIGTVAGCVVGAPAVLAGATLGDSLAAGRADLSRLNPVTGIKETIAAALPSFESLAVTLFELLAKVGNYLVHLFVGWIVPLLTPGFLTNPLVQWGWAIVLGFANLGFVLALLFIALATVLRLSGFDVRRLLVRLLIAALLINFSLIIAGVLLDASRLFMAVIYRAGTNSTLDRLGIDVLESSHLFSNAFHFFVTDGSPAAAAPSNQELRAQVGATAWNVIVGTVVIWALAIALFILVIGLLGRYVFLILLLVASPLAYLFLATPGTSGLAKEWWRQYLKYVFYGPVVLFILTLLIQFKNSNAQTYFRRTFGDFLGDTTLLALTIALLIGATKAGTALGGVAAGAAAGYIGGKLSNWGRRLGGGALRLGGKALYEGTGTGMALRRAGEFGKEVGQDVSRPFRSFFAKGRAMREERRRLAEAPVKRREEKGKERARRLYGLAFADPQVKREMSAVAGTSATDSARDIQGNTGLFDSAHLGQSHVAAALSTGQLTQLAGNAITGQAGLGGDLQIGALANALAGLPTEFAASFRGAKIDAVLDSGNIDLIEGMVSNPEIEKSMTAQQRARVDQSVQGANPGVKPPPIPIPPGATPEQIAQVQQANTEQRADYEKRRSDYKRVLNAWQSTQRKNAEKMYG